MNKEKIAELQKSHEVVAEFNFEHRDIEKGYAKRTLHIDISTGKIETRPVTDQMIDLWTGGRGFDMWLMFKEITKDTKWDSPENPICFSQGPLGGVVSFPGAGKTIATSISPLTNSIIDCNVGGYFGPYFKFAGFDALSITGKSDDEIIIYIDAVSRKVTIEKAPLESVNSHILAEELTEMYADDIIDKKNISVVSAGTGAENSRMGVLNFSFFDWRRGVARLKQAGRGGIGTVLRNKKIKAVIVKNREISPAWRISKPVIPNPVKLEKCTECRGEDEIKNICAIICEWNSDPEYVIEMMQDIQDKERCISRKSIEELCLKTGVPRGKLYHIATFYKTFSLEPKGEKIIQVCLGTACHVKGAANILSSFERELGIKQGETTEDGKFTLEAVACLGCCSLAPVAKIGDEIIGNIKAKDVSNIINAERGEERE
ncbi:NAD(P)H-dependent oxidoreductase subunit E [bacterium]|nr:NAD(P)H-dependent oxidoreductase subunit E [bacterium]